MTGACSWQEKQYLFMYSSTIRSPLISFRENVSPFMSPRNLVGSPRYSTSPLERAMGKENSGKKSPAVMIFPFVPAPAGMKQTVIQKKKTPQIIHLFIA